jgi:hypothetical protein
VLACGNPAGPSIVAPPDAVLAAGATVQVGATVRVNAYVWRDLQPGSGTSGRGLIAGASLRTVDGQALPPGLKIELLWVLQDGQAWRGTPIQEQPAATPAEIPVIARNGPHWTGVVDVVLEVSVGRRRAYVSARGVPIVLAM